MRFLWRLLFLVGAVLLALPFVASSLLVDQRGILIPAHVTSKSEYITVSYSSWTRHLGAALQYEEPDGGATAILQASMDEAAFDRLHKGDVAAVRYLLRRDLPQWPGVKTMRQMHVLPSVRLANESTWTGPKTWLAAHWPVLLTFLAIVCTLRLWRGWRLPGWEWAFAAAILLGMSISYISMFPRAMPAPKSPVKTGTGTVQSVERWKFLFRSAQDRSTFRWQAEQPIAVVGVEFVPQGKTDSVVAVDLIDDGSVPGLAEHAKVSLDYEAASPRVAYLRGATRHFASRNLRGLVVQLFGLMVVTGILLGIAKLAGLWFRKITSRGPIR